MQAIYQIIRSHFFIRLIVVFIIAAFSTTGWANNYTTQQQDTITETIIDSFITTQAVPEKYSTAIRSFYRGNKHQYVWIQSKCTANKY